MSARRLAFRLDAAGCVGCKACQVACQDKHDLPPGVRWRRVVSVEGGPWTREGDAWRADVRSWYVSVACMHCEEPICVEVCPTRAMRRGADGIVSVDATRCIGCRYCAWACPYGAPQLDERSGRMTKCDLCPDHLQVGREPACVEACTMRVLTLVDLAAGDGRTAEGSDEGFPLPPATLTRPRTRLLPHADAAGGDAAAVRIANEEEIS